MSTWTDRSSCNALLIGIVMLALAEVAAANPRWHFEDRFTHGERNNLTGWIEHAHSGLENLLGEMPYSYDVHFHRTSHSREPVPWAHTWKAWNRRAVNFYVDPGFSTRDFERDWTAYHELSHLMFPYLGRQGRWFAEGIASYLQYHAMYAAGELEWAQVISRYEHRFRSARKYSRLDEYAVVDLAQIGRRRGSNVRLYWGGAAYFMEVDRRLSEECGIRLHSVIREYLDCCFGSRERSAGSMIRRFDRMSESTIFSEVYSDTVKQAGFPETEAALAWLRENPPLTVSDRG